MPHPPREITDTERETYARDGAVCLRSVYDPRALQDLLAVWDRVSADPVAHGLVPPGEEHREVGHRATIISRPSHGVPEFRAFLEAAPVPRLLGQLIGAREVGFYWDTIFAKDAGSTWPTSWHSDAGASAVEGEQLPNTWTPLTPVTKESSIECIAGSHRTRVKYWPRTPNGSRLPQPEGRPVCPDFDARRGDPAVQFLTWDMEPGDVVVLHPYTVHYSRGNPTAQRRVAYANWWYGDDIVWDPRPECEAGHPEAPFAQMPAGGRPSDHPLFPIRWRSDG